MQVAIAGAGIAGLAAAIALARRGLAVSLYESAETLAEVGAGIQLSPNAMSVLAALGLAERVARHAVAPRCVAIFDGRSGRRLTEMPLGETARRRYGAPYLVVHRADLQACLLAAAEAEPNLRLALGRTVKDVRQEGNGIVFEAGGEAGRADCLIAADGVHSAIRTGFFGHAPPAQAHHVAWRATLHAPAPPGIDCGLTGLWLGPGVHLVHYPLRGGTEINLVVIAAQTQASGAPPLERFAGAAQALGEQVAAWRPWPLFAADPGCGWVRGRVALIGDAAHAMLPTAAQGGAQALEDAWMLARCLAAGRGDTEQALRRYEAERRPRVGRVAREAARNLAVYELAGAAAAARNLAISALPSKLHLARLDWLYSWSAK